MRGGAPDYFIRVAEEIQRRRDAEDALHDRERKLQAIVQNSPAVIYMKDIDGRYVLVNPNFERIFSKVGEDVLGRTDEDLFPPAIAKARRQREQHVVRSRVRGASEDLISDQAQQAHPVSH